MNDDLNFSDLATIRDCRRTIATNAIIGRWRCAKMRRLIREAPAEGLEHKGYTFGPYGRAALNLKKQGAGIGIARLTLFGRM